MKSVLTLRQVEAFRSVMLAGTVVGAARLMHVTQPGVSRALAMLEMRIGYQLFERKGRRLIPTSQAQMLYREVEPLYNSLDRIAQVAHDIHIQQVGALRIAALPALAHSLLPKTIARFLSTRAKVSVFLHSLPSMQIADLVANGQFEIGVIELPLTRASIVTKPLAPSQSVAVMQPSHRLASRSSISLRELHGERMVLLSQHSVMRYQVNDSFSNLGVIPEVVVETPNSMLACALVAEGLGVTIVSPWTAGAFKTHGLVSVPIKEALTSRFAVVFPDNDTRSHLADAFAKDLAMEFGLPLLEG